MIDPTIWDGIDGILFDAVGTLIEPRPSVAEVYLATARKQGVELEIGEVRDRFHRYFRNDEVDEALGPLKTDEELEKRRWRRIVRSVLAEAADADRAFDELWEHFSDPTHWACFPDVAPALEAIQTRGFSIRIASNFDGRLRRVVGGLPVLSPFKQNLVISSEIGYRKPHPLFYEAGCESLGLAPNRVLSVGDDLENDVLGPARIGIRAVLLERGLRRESARPVCRDLLELVDSLERSVPPSSVAGLGSLAEEGGNGR